LIHLFRIHFECELCEQLNLSQSPEIFAKQSHHSGRIMGYDQLPHAAAPCRNSSRNSTRRDRFIQENKLIVGLCIALTSLFFYLMYQPPQFSCNRKPTVDLVLRSAPLIGDSHPPKAPMS
jgi:hypothetical protein